MSDLIEVHRFVPIGKAMSFVHMGYMPMPSLNGTIHGQFSVHVMWRCCCGERAPDPAVAKALSRAVVRESIKRQANYRIIARSNRRS